MLLMFFPYPEDGVSCGSGLIVVHICHYDYFFQTIMSQSLMFIYVMFKSLPSVQIFGILLQTHFLGLSLLFQLCLLCSLTIIFLNISYCFYNQAYYSFNFLNSKPLFIDGPHALFFYVALAIKVYFLVHFTTFFYLFFLSSHFFPEPDIEYLVKLYL